MLYISLNSCDESCEQFDKIMAVTPRTNRSTTPNVFCSSGRDSSRMDRRMDARFEALEKDYASLSERMLNKQIF